MADQVSNTVKKTRRATKKRLRAHVDYEEMSVNYGRVKLGIPAGFKESLETVTREILREQPSDIVGFLSAYFGALNRNQKKGIPLNSLVTERIVEVKTTSDAAEQAEPEPVEQQTQELQTDDIPSGEQQAEQSSEQAEQSGEQTEQPEIASTLPSQTNLCESILQLSCNEVEKTVSEDRVSAVEESNEECINTSKNTQQPQQAKATSDSKFEKEAAAIISVKSSVSEPTNSRGSSKLASASQSNESAQPIEIDNLDQLPEGTAVINAELVIKNSAEELVSESNTQLALEPEAEEAPQQEAQEQEASEQESQEQAPQEESPQEEAPQETSPQQEAPQEEAEQEQTPQEEAQQEEPQQEEAPQEESKQEEATEQAPEQEISAEDAPQDETPDAEEAQDQEAPQEESPNEESPQEESPQEESPQTEASPQEAEAPKQEAAETIEKVESKQNVESKQSASEVQAQAEE